MQNASALYNLLIRDSPGIRFDVVSHSMGGLVARCLIERCYLPEEIKETNDFLTNVDRLFMVGTTNFGSPRGLYLESCPYLGFAVTDEPCLSMTQRLLDLFPGAQQLLPTSEFLTKILNSSPKSIIAARRSSNTRYYWLSGSFSDSNLCSTGRSDGWVCMPSKTEITFLGLGDENTKTFEADHSSLHANCTTNGVCSEIVKRTPPSPPRNLKVR